MPRKPKTEAQLLRHLKELMQRHARLSAADKNGNCRCVSCGAVKHWSEMDGGHFIGAALRSHRVSDVNINPQCKACNGPRNNGTAQIAYTFWMIDRYGEEFVRNMLADAGKPTKFSRTFLQGQIDYYRERNKRLEDEKK